jgi:hypothetical protein
MAMLEFRSTNLLKEVWEARRMGVANLSGSVFAFTKLVFVYSMAVLLTLVHDRVDCPSCGFLRF